MGLPDGTNTATAAAIPLAEDQPEALGGHIAERQQHAGPDKGRDKVRDLKAPERHLENPRDQRYRGAQRPEEAADENAKRAPLPDEGFAARNEIRMARQRPDMLHAIFEFQADPV